MFLDRDGVINRDSPDFIKSPEELDMLPGAAEALARLNASGFACIIITNQSGIARGLFTSENLAALHTRLNAELAAAGAHLTAIYHCPHGPDDGCECRKPATGMVRRAVREHRLDLTHSWLVGDRPGDIVCGAAVGCKTILVLSGNTTAYDPACFSSVPDHVGADLTAAVDIILSESTTDRP